jgi:hypothetical protein
MTDETQAEMPVEGAPVVETVTESPPVQEAVESSKPDTDKELSKRVQERIDELTREKYDRAREAEYWRSIAQQAQQPKPEPKAVEVKLPTLEEHGYDEAKYQAALIQYATQQAEKVVEERLSKVEQQRAEQKRLEAFAERQRAFVKATPDFEARVLQDPTLPITEGMRDVIVDSENGPEIAYYLAQNRETAEAIARLPAHLAALEMGRIEGRLAAQKEAAKRPPPVSQAPPPPPTLETTEAAGPKDPAEMSDAEWYRAEKRKQNLKQFKKA